MVYRSAWKMATTRDDEPLHAVRVDVQRGEVLVCLLPLQATATMSVVSKVLTKASDERLIYTDSL
eukprot:12610249-Prorocentrum_lima.AAC.1